MEYWEGIHQRGVDTCAVWNQHNAAFKVGALTLALHTADVQAMPDLVQQRDDAEDEYDQAIDAKDDNLKFISEMNVRGVAMMRGNLEGSDPLQRELDDVSGIENKGAPKILARARKLTTLWVKVNAARSAQVPPLGALLVGTNTVASAAAAVGNHENHLQAVAQKLSAWQDARSALKAAAAQVDRNNKRWYEAWSGFYVAGSAEYDALSQIDTGAGEVALPGPVTFSAMHDAQAEEIHIDASAEHATHFRMLRRAPGETEFVERASNEASPIHDPVSLTGVYEVKVQARNSAGDGPVSAGQNVTVV